MGWGKVTAVVNKTLGGADVVVEPGMPDAEQSRLVSSRVTVPADGKTTANIVVLVRDQFGNAVTGARVTLISSRQDRVEQPGPSNEQGIAVGRIHSTSAGLSEISAVVESVRISNFLRLTFQPTRCDWLARTAGEQATGCRGAVSTPVPYNFFWSLARGYV